MKGARGGTGKASSRPIDPTVLYVPPGNHSKSHANICFFSRRC